MNREIPMKQYISISLCWLLLAKQCNHISYNFDCDPEGFHPFQKHFHTHSFIGVFFLAQQFVLVLSRHCIASHRIEYMQDPIKSNWASKATKWKRLREKVFNDFYGNNIVQRSITSHMNRHFLHTEKPINTEKSI